MDDVIISLFAFLVLVGAAILALILVIAPVVSEVRREEEHGGGMLYSAIGVCLLALMCIIASGLH